MLDNKIVLITGASGGLGAETARLLSAKGAVPVLTGRSETKLAAAAAGLSGKYGLYPMDVTSDADVERVIRQAAADFGRIDVLVNNAGYGLFETFEEAELSTFADMMNTNYMGVVRCSKAVLPLFLNLGRGHIVNVASMAGKISTAKASGYAATKHAVLGLTNAMRSELAPRGIAVSAVNPGPIDTPFFQVADPDGSYAANVQRFMLSPERVAKAVVNVIETRKTEVDLPRAAAIGIRLYGLVPRLADRIAGRWLNRK